MLFRQKMDLHFNLNILLLMIALLLAGIQCLSLDDIHSSSSQQRSKHYYTNSNNNNNDNNAKNREKTSLESSSSSALLFNNDRQRRLQQQHQQQQQYSPSRGFDYLSLPVFTAAAEYNRRLLSPRVIRPPDADDVIDVPLEYNEIDSNYLMPEQHQQQRQQQQQPSANDLISTALAIKLSSLWHRNDKNSGSNSIIGEQGFNILRDGRERNNNNNNNNNVKRKRSVARSNNNLSKNKALLSHPLSTNTNNVNNYNTKAKTTGKASGVRNGVDYKHRQRKFQSGLSKSSMKSKRKSSRRLLNDQFDAMSNSVLLRKNSKGLNAHQKNHKTNPNSTDTILRPSLLAMQRQHQHRSSSQLLSNADKQMMSDSSSDSNAAKRKKFITKRKANSQIASSLADTGSGSNSDDINDYKIKPKHVQSLSSSVESDNNNNNNAVINEINDIIADDTKESNKEVNKHNQTNNTDSQSNSAVMPANSGQKLIHHQNSNPDLIKKKSKRSSSSISSNLPMISDIMSDDNNNNVQPLDLVPNDSVTEEEVKTDESSRDDRNPSDRETFDEWLRREYYNNIAKSLATMRRKRSENNYIFPDDGADNSVAAADGDDDDNDNTNSIEDTIDENIISMYDTGDDSFDNNNNIVVNNNNDVSSDNNNNNNENEGNLKIADKLVNNNDIREESIDDYVVATEDEVTAVDDDDDVDSETDNNKDQLILTEVEEKTAPVVDIKINHKTKRSVQQPDVENNLIEDEYEEESQRTHRIDNRLQLIEDALISEALSLIENSARKGSRDESEKFKIENRLDAAYDIEDMRATLENLHQTIDKMRQEEEAENDGNRLPVDISRIPLDFPIIPVQVDGEETIDKKSFSDNDVIPVKILVPYTVKVPVRELEKLPPAYIRMHESRSSDDSGETNGIQRELEQRSDGANAIDSGYSNRLYDNGGYIEDEYQG